MFGHTIASLLGLSAGTAQPAFDPLEGRQLLAGITDTPGITGPHALGSVSIEFKQAPSAVRTGLDALAVIAGVPAPDATSTQKVFLSNADGIQSYALDFTNTTAQVVLTVDQFGNAVSQHTRSDSTWEELSGSGSGSNPDAANALEDMASELDLRSPNDTTTVRVTRMSNGETTYSVTLKGSYSSFSRDRKTTITVDSNGNPAGNQNLPFRVMPHEIRSGLNLNRPNHASSLDSDSDRCVQVRTNHGVVTYSVVFIARGKRRTVTVDSSGEPTDLPSTSTSKFKDIPTASQAQLQSLATAAGFSSQIRDSQSVRVYDEANGTVLYSVTLSVTKTRSNGKTYSARIKFTTDQSGNPTVEPTDSRPVNSRDGSFLRLDLGIFGEITFS